MWSVKVCGAYALMTFAWQGAFLADIGDRIWGDLTVLSLKDPKKPVLLHHSIEAGNPDKVCPAEDFIL